jgi:hypothetical protein
MEGLKVSFGEVCCLHLQNRAEYTYCYEAKQYSASCLLGLIFHAEDGESAVLRNVGKLLKDYTVSHSKIFIVTTAGPSDLIQHFFVVCKLFSSLTEDGIQIVGCRLQLSYSASHECKKSDQWLICK